MRRSGQWRMHRPLVQTNKLAKAKLAAWRKLQSEKIDAKKEAVQK